MGGGIPAYHCPAVPSEGVLKGCVLQIVLLLFYIRKATGDDVLLLNGEVEADRVLYSIDFFHSGEKFWIVLHFDVVLMFDNVQYHVYMVFVVEFLHCKGRGFLRDNLLSQYWLNWLWVNKTQYWGGRTEPPNLFSLLHDYYIGLIFLISIVAGAEIFQYLCK